MKDVIKKFLSNKKILPSLLLLFLMIGISATIIGLQRSTEYRQQASTIQNDSPYQIVPVIYLPADFNSNIGTYTTNVKNNFIEVSQWYMQQISKTFNPADPVVYQSGLTSSQIISKYPDALAGFTNGYFVKYEIPIALSANGKDICDSTKIYYLVTPINVNWGGSGGREFFGCERFPGYASIPGHMGRLIGGIIDPNWPEWWAVEPRQAKGGVAHELAHLFGAYCDPTGCNLTPHNDNPKSIMNAWWDYETLANPVTIDLEALEYINRSSQIIFLTPPSVVSPVIPTSTPAPTIQPTSTPSHTPTITPTATPTLTPTPTITPTAAPGLTPLPTFTPTFSPTSTPIPTPTKAPTPTPSQENTIVKVTIGLDGIGNTGDNTNRTDTSASNKNPKRTSRNVTVQVFNGGDVFVDSYNGKIEYNSSLGLFVGDINLFSIPSGNYLLKIKSDGYLNKRVPGFISIFSGQTLGISRIDLIAGDINNDSILNIADYNILNDCIFAPATTHGTVCSQNPNYLINSDLTDNGIKDIYDINLFMRELTTRYGD